MYFLYLRYCEPCPLNGERERSEFIEAPTEAAVIQLYDRMLDLQRSGEITDLIDFELVKGHKCSIDVEHRVVC